MIIFGVAVFFIEKYTSADYYKEMMDCFAKAI
jgi:hypothetical protein